MPPVENIVIAGSVVVLGSFGSRFLALTPHGVRMVRWATAVVAFGILVAPFFR